MQTAAPYIKTVSRACPMRTLLVSRVGQSEVDAFIHGICWTTTWWRWLQQWWRARCHGDRRPVRLQVMGADEPTPETAFSGSSRESFSANRCELEPEHFSLNRKRHEPEPDLFFEPFFDFGPRWWILKLNFAGPVLARVGSRSCCDQVQMGGVQFRVHL